MSGPAMDWLEPGIRNSNLLPVKATGEVRLRSVVSCGMEGSTSTPMRSVLRSVVGIVALTDDGVDDALQLVAEEDGDDGRRRFLRAETVIVAREGDGAAQQLLILVHALDEGGEEEQELRRSGWAFCRGRSRFSPVSVESDQLSCLPEPLTPAKGFSCSRQTRPWRSATFFIVSMTSWFWSLAVLASQ